MIRYLMILSSLILLVLIIYFNNSSIVISKYRVKSSKISKEFDKFKIIHLSDFHSYGSQKYMNKLIRKINNENPNIIVMTGDMLNKYDTNFEKFFYLAETLSKNYQIYYIVGNHEKRLIKEDLRFVLKKLNQLGINILNNEKLTIRRNGNCINIYGIDIPLSFYKIRKRPSNIEEVINTVLSKCNEKKYNIVLAHNPLYFEAYAKYNVDLIFSGHVHGGMIRLPFIGALLSPERKFFPKYSSGIYKIDDKKLIVSRGLGHSRLGIRLFNTPEILSITLEQCI